ncbi:SDR family oxidoreductase [Aestuariirhabdus sp. Z084]|uniref:SDR family oxidoreductase n=1 Tax=Aestuariirhabdus haliotis TaxID=2918751 RepID=UPI00201B35A4|nr:SDR family oxidoreductase [Aestuariirhabdus haliotis]MCL6414917.1 SDR family oxidoreductase [Aestuariirhabdus haliotis]MCL6418849.1 SDR family oxidoreductase [Aestuariirhabdus haliotis]
MMKRLLITGASRGIGAAMAELAVQRGYRVMINYRENHQAAQTLVDRLTALGGQAELWQADVSDEQAVAKMFVHLDRCWGGLDALVNNAGMLEQQCRLDNIDGARLQRVFACNVFGSFYCAREAVKRMSTRHGGSGGAIVNLSSIAASLGAPGEYVDYAAAKGAIDSFTRGLAKEVANEGVRVNGVRPGVIDTEIHACGGEPERVARVARTVPMHRGGTATEVAQAVLWLLSDEATYCTGSLLDVSGGR